MTKGRWILAGLVVALVGFATVMGLRPKAPPPVEVTTSAAKKGTVTRVVTAAGHLQARETVKVSSNVTGDLLSLSVKEGDHVNRGQVLGQIDKRFYETQVTQFRGAVASARASIAQIEVAIEQDKRDVERMRRLTDERLASAAELDKLVTQLKMDEGRLAAQKELVAQNVGQLETALYNLSRATLTAPIDGTVLELSHKVGERIRGSDFSEDVVMLMGGLADMEVKAEVGEHEVVAIHVGDDTAVEIDAIPDKQFKGHVVAVGKNAQIKNPGTDAEVTTFFVRVGLDVPPESALPGMSSAVSISTATHDNVVMIPIQAVTSREAKKKEQKAAPREGEIKVADATTTTGTSGTNGGYGKDDPPTKAATGKPKPVKVVFVVDKDGVTQMREVQTGIASRTDVEVLSGIAEGETVVDGPYRTLARELQEGQKVKPQKPGQGAGDKGPQGGRS
ncbi:MAG: efflux RND transporter periplasmic adaptor subunit [Deltaproteobacteria bacterium]|nr:MAG: efflux RND transporter periplasmic adaptor subunit [Deltaproteobacteria bacterium]TMB40096.1 MAG: efflux RND transporter periplasmic adaptor subunit [Deltaproteobacteria bacterium]